MSSILEQAFRSTCAVKRQVTGQVDLVAINGKSFEDTLLEILTSAEVFVAGGKAESGGFKVQILISDFDTAPKKFDDIVALGMSLKILAIDNVNNLVYLITAGDPTTET